jgi:glucose/arabinose dehydrogenase
MTAALAGTLLAAALAPVPGTAAIRVPPGFAASVYTRGLSEPTAMAFGPDGRVYVAQNGGTVVAIGASRRPVRFASRFPVPLGLAWLGRTLYVSRSGGVDSVRLAGTAAVGRRVVVSRLPFKEHQQDNLVVGSDGRLYLGSGSTCDVCVERDRRSAAILSFRPDGSDRRVVATGLRNPYGLAVQPSTGRLFASVNGQDKLGDGEPAESIVEVRRGRFYGWPRCWPSFAGLRLVGSCAGVAAPVAYLEPHSSADGMAFYTGSSFPDAYRGDLFVAEWGEYLSKRHGRKLVHLPFDAHGHPLARRATTFATGFDHPLAVAVDPQTGDLLVADWGRGTIYAIRRVPSASAAAARRRALEQAHAVLELRHAELQVLHLLAQGEAELLQRALHRGTGALGRAERVAAPARRQLAHERPRLVAL